MNTKIESEYDTERDKGDYSVEKKSGKIEGANMTTGERKKELTKLNIKPVPQISVTVINIFVQCLVVTMTP